MSHRRRRRLWLNRFCDSRLYVPLTTAMTIGVYLVSHYLLERILA